MPMTVTPPTTSVVAPIASTPARPTSFVGAPPPAPEDAFTGNVDPRPARSGRSDVYLGTGNDSFLPSASRGAEAGKQLAIHYLRYPATIGSGEYLDKLRFFSRVDGVLQPMQEFDVQDGNTWDAYGAVFTVDVPAGARGKVEYWFEAQTRSGQRIWDTNFGKNFAVPIVPSSTSTVKFDEDWAESMSGNLKRGASFEIAYDVDRLRRPLGNGWYRMGNTFFTAAYVSFDGKPAEEYRLTNWNGDRLTVAQPRVTVPDDAREMRIWFRASTVAQSMYDSDYGHDYRFAIEE